MLLILMGKTCSGKDTVANLLCKNHGFKKIVTYTTRLMRPGEIDGVTYHYINEDEFIAKIKAGYFVEWKIYHTVSGDWYYGCSKESLESVGDEDYVVILTPAGIRDLKASGLDCVFKVIYLIASDRDIRDRLISRGDDPKEAERRMLHDIEDFCNVIEDKLHDVVMYRPRLEQLNRNITHILNYLRTHSTVK